MKGKEDIKKKRKRRITEKEIKNIGAKEYTYKQHTNE